MKSIILCIILCLGNGKENNSPEQFVKSLYKGYGMESHTSIFFTAQVDSLLAPELLTLVKLDKENTHGEIGFLDWDPLCDCQDDGGFKLKGITTDKKKDITFVKVNFKLSEIEMYVILSLKNINGNWLIYDVKTKEIKSLLHFLSENLKN